MKKIFISLFFIFLFLGCISTGEKPDKVEERILSNNQKIQGATNKMFVIFALNHTVSYFCGENCNSFYYENTDHAISVQSEEFSDALQEHFVLTFFLGECDRSCISDEECTVSFAQPRLCSSLQESNNTSPEFAAYACNYK